MQSPDAGASHRAEEDDIGPQNVWATHEERGHRRLGFVFRFALCREPEHLTYGVLD
jgi:hypothetical protein